MSPWLLAFLACLPALAVAVYRGLHGRCNQRLIALELTAALGTLMLVLLSFAWPRDQLLDLALALALLAIPGTLVCTHFLERWL